MPIYFVSDQYTFDFILSTRKKHTQLQKNMESYDIQNANENKRNTDVFK